METHAHSALALAESAKYTSMDDTSTRLVVEVGEADEQIGESRVGTVEEKAWGNRAVAWIGGAVFVGTVIVVLAVEWYSAVKLPDLHSFTQLDLIHGGIFHLKSNLSAFYLHVSSESTSSGDPVFHTDSTTAGSEWHLEYVDDSDRTVMLKNCRSGFYLHVADEFKNSGDRVFHRNSTSDGSKWQVEHAPPWGAPPMIMLKSVRSGFYLHAKPRSKRTCCDPVFHTDSVTDGSKWIMEATSTSASRMRTCIRDDADSASSPTSARASTQYQTLLTFHAPAGWDVP
jgi:hypothetical protein